MFKPIPATFHLTFHLQTESFIYIFKRLELRNIPGIDGFPSSRLYGTSPIQYILQALQDIDDIIDEIRLARDDGLPAAIAAVFSCILHRDLELFIATQDGAIVVDDGLTLTVREDFSRLVDEGFRRMFMNAHTERRKQEVHRVHEVQHLIRDIVRRVFAIARNAAENRCHEDIVHLLPEELVVRRIFWFIFMPIALGKIFFHRCKLPVIHCPPSRSDKADFIMRMNASRIIDDTFIEFHKKAT